MFNFYEKISDFFNSLFDSLFDFLETDIFDIPKKIKSLFKKNIFLEPHEEYELPPHPKYISENEGYGFKVGDLVICISSYDDNEYILNKKGKVKTIQKHREVVGIEFFENIHGHDLHYRCKEGYGWNIPVKLLKKTRNSKYVKQIDWEDNNFYKIKRGNNV